MAKGFRHVDDTERRLVRNMVKEGIPWVTIQRITGRSPDTIRSGGKVQKSQKGNSSRVQRPPAQDCDESAYVGGKGCCKQHAAPMQDHREAEGRAVY